jgi:alpha-beta hydrolase superfamily lysophospholipase
VSRHRWHPAPPGASTRAVALVLHGLNNRPETMTAIAELLAARGAASLIVALRGHGDGLAAFKTVTREGWLSEVAEAYAAAQARAAERGVPVLLVGFSLGALLGNDLLSRADRVAFDGMILFAPALRIHGYLYALRLLAPLPRLILPSYAPPAYAANPGTPMAAYNALFASLAALRRHRARTAPVPALVFVDPADELVSYRALRRWRPQGDGWTLVPVRKPLRPGGRDYHHLIIDADCAGAEAWAVMSDHVGRFLDRLAHGRATPAAARRLASARPRSHEHGGRL